MIDNLGDIGVCWRLAADLASRGQQVRLWVDDASALAWMAPGALQGAWPGVQVLPWEQSRDASVLAALPAAEVWVEGFGCEIPAEFLAHRFDPGARAQSSAQPVWINLEYLSAESFARRAHGLPSPILSGPASGCTRHFFYPGFTPQSGGLLREPDLAQRQSAFDRAAWLASLGIPAHGERLVSLFCYRSAPLQQLLAQLRQGDLPTRLLVTAGQATAELQHLPGLAAQAAAGVTPGESGLDLRTSFLPLLSQLDFDHLLWCCDLNFVRGEDSLVRAIWAGKPFVWQIYPQHDDAHHGKLEAFLDAALAPPSWRHFHRVWNGVLREPLPRPELELWRPAIAQFRHQLAQQSDLGTRLLEFAENIRASRAIAPEKR